MKFNPLIAAIAKADVKALKCAINDPYAVWIEKDGFYIHSVNNDKVAKQDMEAYQKQNNITCNIFLPHNDRV